jgi:hypothetical protein
MSALNNQTNRNQNRYFFATTENGEQTLGLQFGTTGGSPNLSTMAVTISGSGGNGVIVNTAPSFQATDYIFAEEGMGVYGSTYFTPSTLSGTITGLNLSTDRANGSGIACIESYAGNGSTGGFEFLSRGVGSALLSTPMDSYFSSIGRPGATAVLGASGSLVAGAATVGTSAVALSAADTGSGGVGALNINDLSGGQSYGRWSWYKYGAVGPGDTGSDLALGAYNNNGTFLASALTARRATGQIATINQYTYPQALITVPAVAQAPGGVSVANATVVSLLSITGVTGLVAGQYYLTDVNVQISVTSALAVGAFLDFGVRLGGNGSFSYGNTIFVPVGGIPFNVQISLNQISDMGTATPGLVEVVGYQQNASSGAITVAASIASGGASHQFKNIT